MLPAFGVTGSDVDAVKFTQVLRGYKASEVDWVLDRLARELEALRGQLAAVHAASAAQASQASQASDAEAAEAEADGLELPDGPDAGDHRDAT